MTAIEDARTALAKLESVALGDALSARALRDLIAEHERLTAPPTDDEREQLDQIMAEACGYWPPARAMILERFRRQRPITDAMVLAGAKELDADAFEVPLRGYGEGAGAQARESALEGSRAVLEAARDAS
jgi:hypothetical protein